ncbi:flagellin N-terminal helical domain-containing protein [Parerythrobacter jejuensis]|uniref:Flagellar biosynthesis protein FlgL n=1 Tax=Parerythrobacter jejuensis TaxID=795812 RepID=A0A845AN64_9SPHN|nr:flagellar biosynthesis protein FlgL [Parerythrobacter jejuensis]MXP30603.1 flagellar biosynthesis protein FlgL [Parerythrobacter jejuensis]MXP33363.1 flagellar biosynthesis protein FlgL [Parerythrobacter jejuensis]
MTFDAVTNSTAAFFRRSQVQMDALRAEAEALQLQVSTGERLERSSDDPVASARLRSLARADRLASVEANNSARAKEEITGAATRMEDIANALIRARELAVQAASDSTAQDTRVAIADELEALRQTIFASLNAAGSTGRALFGGEVSGPPYALDPAGNALYTGGTDPGVLAIAEGVEVERGITGPSVTEFSFGGNATDTLAFLRTIANGLRGVVSDPAQFARDSIAGFDAALDTLNRGQTVLGVRFAWIDTVDQAQQLRAEARAQEGGDIGGTDLASAITQLQQTLTVLEASQASFVRLASLSLFDQI